MSRQILLAHIPLDAVSFHNLQLLNEIVNLQCPPGSNTNANLRSNVNVADDVSLSNGVSAEQPMLPATAAYS